MTENCRKYLLAREKWVYARINNLSEEKSLYEELNEIYLSLNAEEIYRVIEITKPGLRQTYEYIHRINILLSN